MKLVIYKDSHPNSLSSGVLYVKSGIISSYTTVAAAMLKLVVLSKESVVVLPLKPIPRVGQKTC
jgi:hypothetical protein